MTRAKDCELTLSIILDEAGIDSEKAEVLEREIVKSRPDFIQFVPPRAFYIAYTRRLTANKQSASLLLAIRALSGGDDRFRRLKIACHHGEGTCYTDSLGRLTDIPDGEVTYLALKDVCSPEYRSS